MRARLDRHTAHRLIESCSRDLPNESCGFLIGGIHSKGYEITSFIRIPNRSVQPHIRFEMEPAAAIPLLTNPQSNIVGIYHSHPTADGKASERDLHTLWNDIPLYCIISFQDKLHPQFHLYETKKAVPISLSKLSLAID